MKYLFEDTFQFSYSDFKDYGICPYRFALKYQLKKKGIYPRAANSRHFVCGWCSHKCVELWNKIGKWEEDWMFEAVVKLHPSSFGNSSYTYVEHNPDGGNLILCTLKDYVTKNNVLWTEEYGMENAIHDVRHGLEIVAHWIKVLGMNHDRMESEKKFQFHIPELNIVSKGYVDLLDHETNRIYDFKFSRSGYTDWRQLAWYALMIRMETGMDIQRVFTFNPFHSEPLEDRSCDEESLREVYNLLTCTVQRIRDGVYDAAPERKYCSECQVERHCGFSVLR